MLLLNSRGLPRHCWDCRQMRLHGQLQPQSVIRLRGAVGKFYCMH